MIWANYSIIAHNQTGFFYEKVFIRYPLFFARIHFRLQ